jgi:DNA-directed RNA polymerase sigma subunit (sigma70/sigma32)
MRYRGYGLPLTEVISEGNVGLILAVKRFGSDANNDRERQRTDRRFKCLI